MKRWLCVLRSRAHRGQNSSVTPTELGSCSTTDGRESGGRKHRSSMFGSWLSATHQLGSKGTGSEWRTRQVIRLNEQTHIPLQRYTHAQVNICTSPNSKKKKSCAQYEFTFMLYEGLVLIKLKKLTACLHDLKCHSLCSSKTSL